MSEDDLLELLRTKLTIDVKTTSEYTGGVPLYQDCKTILLLLDGEVISEVSL